MNEIEARLAEIRPELAAAERKVQDGRETRQLLQDAAKAATIATINTPGSASDKTATQARERLQQAFDAERKSLDADEDLRASIQQLEAEHADLAKVVKAQEFEAARQALQTELKDLAPKVARAVVIGSALSVIGTTRDWWFEGLARDLERDLGLQVKPLIHEGRLLVTRIRAGGEV